MPRGYSGPNERGDGGKPYDYIRPLATIEPTAIRFALPVDVSLCFDDRAGLLAALEVHRTPNRNALLLVAWEHRQNRADRPRAASGARRRS
jgi:hypothetical protein